MGRALPALPAQMEPIQMVQHLNVNHVRLLVQHAYRVWLA